MSVLSELDAARVIIRSLKANVAELSDTLADLPRTPDQARQFEQTIELRFALIAVVEAAIENGTPAATALLALRDTGATAWGLKLYVQYAGSVPNRVVADNGTNLASVMADAAGRSVTIRTAYTDDQPFSSSSVRH